MSEIKGVLIFYIDVGQLPPEKADEFVDQTQKKAGNLLDLLRKQGYENLFLPIRQPGHTRVEILPLEIDF